MSSVASEIHGSVIPGSHTHRQLLAQFFLDTHIEFEPEAIAWPALDAPTRERLRRLPFWQEAVSTEDMTSRTVTAAAVLEPDAQVRRAIALQGLEEQRHARLLQALTAHFQIDVVVPRRPVSPASLEHDFLFAGFGECFDSFFAFGLFRIAGTSGFFPAELVQIFEPVIQEEARHILFFVNWVKYRRRQLPLWRRPLFRLRCGWIILQQIASRVHTARTLSGAPASGSPGEAATAHTTGAADTAAAENFTLSAHQDLGESVTLRSLLQLCLQENERRLAPYDRRLARPRLVPAMVRWALRLMRLWPHGREPRHKATV
jgi:hypothetical protein